MKYEKPEVVELMPAVNAIQNVKNNRNIDGHDTSPAYEDWEE
jgi:hypothetical protein